MALRSPKQPADMRKHRAKVKSTFCLQIHDRVNQANAIPVITKGQVHILKLGVNQADAVMD